MTYHENSLSINISTIGVDKIFDWEGRGKTQIICNDDIRYLKNVEFLWDRNTVEWKVRSRGLCVWHIIMFLLKGETFNQNL